MNSALDAFSDQVPLCTGRLGLRRRLPVHIQAPPTESAGTDPLPQPHPAAAVLDFTSSDETLDRYDEIISVSGWRLDNYRRNPVFQNAHQYGDILFTLGKALITEIRTLPPNPALPHAAGPPRTVLFQRIEFAVAANPVARIAHALYAGKFLNSVSVGFIPIRWEDAPSGAAAKHFRRRHLEQELLEVSAVAIPANPNALALAFKSGAIHKSDLAQTIDLLRLAIGSNARLSTLNTQLFQLRALLRR